MTYRKVPLIKNNLYHIINKSIAGFRIFNSGSDYKRMMDTIIFYSIKQPACRFSWFKEFHKDEYNFIEYFRKNYSKKLIDIITYCLMPTHIHFILKELKEDGISKYMNLILMSYSRYFNLKHHRKGPLWEGRFKNILIETDEQFIHLTRYIHINPVKARLVSKPEEWNHSSYNEYIGANEKSESLCNFSEYLNRDCLSYKEFVDAEIDYKRNFKIIKHLILE